MSNPQVYRVFKAKFKLAIQDPDMPGPRYHTIIFVETNGQGPGSGVKHHVTGDIVSGMRYESTPIPDPKDDEVFYSKELIGYTSAANYPQVWDEFLETLPAPPRQKAFNLNTMRTEPVKTWEPLTFYEPNEPRRPLVKCTEWIEQQAIPVLISEGLLQST